MKTCRICQTSKEDNCFEVSRNVCKKYRHEQIYQARKSNPDSLQRNSDWFKKQSKEYHKERSQRYRKKHRQSFNKYQRE